VVLRKSWKRGFSCNFKDEAKEFLKGKIVTVKYTSSSSMSIKKVWNAELVGSFSSGTTYTFTFTVAKYAFGFTALRVSDVTLPDSIIDTATGACLLDECADDSDPPAPVPGRWVIAGNKGLTCGEVCSNLGLTCDANEQSKLVNRSLLAAAMEEVGFPCRSFTNPNGLPGVPWTTGLLNPANPDDQRNYRCTPIRAGKTSSCTRTKRADRMPLCYCRG